MGLWEGIDTPVLGTSSDSSISPIYPFPLVCYSSSWNYYNSPGSPASWRSFFICKCCCVIFIFCYTASLWIAKCLQKIHDNCTFSNAKGRGEWVTHFKMLRWNLKFQLIPFTEKEAKWDLLMIYLHRGDYLSNLLSCWAFDALSYKGNDSLV